MASRIAIVIAARPDGVMDVIGLMPSNAWANALIQIENKILEERRRNPDSEIMVLTCNQGGTRLRVHRPVDPTLVQWKGTAPELY